ncbi:Imm41 family immunity protein [Helicobacter sp. 11S02596-1]|uniref:Imm41 family immunity protein n=1 Tax=Helicobacter sp. 11S02596-1 TaxID=1476194 RepID=UPI000BA5FD97|nr:Imm41 family immunity protein [Helicobacter sp. 11S02596-1]PAF44762.1 hypothetical protein BJI48_01885 [Helicobacter sp. 11S02596-1]
MFNLLYKESKMLGLDYSKIPLEVARNHNVLDNNFFDRNSFVGIWLDYTEWSDDQYWKLKKGIAILIKNNSKHLLDLELRAVTTRLIELFMGINPLEFSLHFKDIDVDLGEDYPDISDRIEDFKFLIMSMVANKNLDISSIYIKNPNPQTRKIEKITLLKNKNISRAKYIIFDHFKLGNAYYFNSGLEKYLCTGYMEKPAFKDKKFPYKIFLVLTNKCSGWRKVLDKRLAFSEGGKIVYKHKCKKDIFYILEFCSLQEEILELLLAHKQNQIFYMSFPYGNNYDVLNKIFDEKCQSIQARNLQANIKNLIREHSGIFITYEDKKDKQILSLKFYWKASKNCKKTAFDEMPKS